MQENHSIQTASALLINQLNASQQQRIRLNDAVPSGSKVAARHLEDWFTRAFPTLAGSVSVEEILVCRLQDEVIPQSERTANGPVFKRTVTDTTPLETLFWRAVAGQLNAREFFLESGSIDLITDKDGLTQMPAALNSRGAKEEIKRLLHITPQAYEQLLTQALDDFWDKPAPFSQGRNVSDWLTDEFAAQLKAQADLHRLDGMLSLPMHKALTDLGLSAQDAASRAKLAERFRPGVYSLSITPEGWGFEVPIPYAVALTQHDNPDNPACAVLYSPGAPLETYADLSALKSSLAKDDNAQDKVNTAPIAERFLARLVTQLRAEQKTAMSNVLLGGPARGEKLSNWVARLDAAANLRDGLDLAGAMDEREWRLNQKKLDDWLRANPNVTGSERVAWWRALQDLQQAMEDKTPPPDPVLLATHDALQDRIRTLLAGFIKEKYAPADPDQISLSIRKQVVDPHAPTGESPFGSGVALNNVKAIVDDRRSLTEWAMSNLTPDERNAAHVTVEGPLTFTQIVEVIERANVGTRLPAELQLAARRRQAEWMSVKAKQIRAQAWAAHISGDLRHDKDNTGLNLVLAALDNPESEGRRTVNGHEVVVRQIQWGDSVLKEMLAFGVKKLASRPSLTLYTPGAPDGKTFRDVDAGSDRELEAALVQTLTTTLEMTRWLISQLPLSEQADPLASLVPASETLTFNEKIKKITQPAFSWIKHRVQDDFASSVYSPVVKGNLLKTLHETQITHALKTADALTVTHAERDSTAAQQGRRNGVMLLTGAMAMFYAGRLGGVLGRTILPTMAGGVAVSAIKDEDGSFSQWAGDFISGLGEVMAEGGQDLIMARTARRRGMERPRLSSLPRIPDPALQPFLLKGFTGKGLVPEGRDRYRDAGGQGYLKLGNGYYKTAVQEGQQIIYAPDNRTHQQRMSWKNGHWHVEEPGRLRGGGIVESLFGRTPETPEQRTYNALVEAVLVNHHWPSREVLRTARKVINAMPEELAGRILRESMDDINISDIDTYRSRLNYINKGLHGLAQHKVPHENLLYKYNVWQAVEFCTRDLESQGTTFTSAQKIKIFDMTLPLKRELFDSEGNFKMMMSSLPDNLTGALFITIIPEQGKKKAAMTRIQNDIHDVVAAAENRVWAELGSDFPGEGPEVEAAKEKFKKTPENFAQYKSKKLAIFRDEMKKRHKPGLLTEIRNNKIPYLIVNKGKSLRKTLLVTQDDITHFTKNLSNYDTFDIEVVTQVPSKKVPGKTPTLSTSSALPEASTAKEKFTVSASILAETQMSYNSFPEAARTKITEIMDDIRAGRATTKRINKFYWYDMAQLSPGSGRGAWRAAFERKGDTWTLQGFYDYHVNRPATVWEG
ncbi:dermonecrotic toxin domain-containing protein [Pseudomonas fluorescens]|uniref:dermonecrotic toxin domain-containing protein n=1 Tax=Pseudomonas fluorescens TaxID=294 RepID=UPI001BE91571|nr:DUF6543 domain-containing protein [Pseudomonas fluorescens]MBT2296711.1 hypothetical protein [Pseudomonas fluorescens]MBT2307773.1 hypothetical protein [Pseudomonas fluorescens]MBT2313149.1 hypothetical protein [Pseudomonas fluorescens]MBT2317300.1 hypothetical protein [Pseudomonas fluorescens]MBT2343790.1 hypothetical protein [Pseudomonas fluorescens]